MLRLFGWDNGSNGGEGVEEATNTTARVDESDNVDDSRDREGSDAKENGEEEEEEEERRDRDDDGDDDVDYCDEDADAIMCDGDGESAESRNVPAEEKEEAICNDAAATEEGTGMAVCKDGEITKPREDGERAENDGIGDRRAESDFEGDVEDARRDVQGSERNSAERGECPAEVEGEEAARDSVGDRGDPLVVDARDPKDDDDGKIDSPIEEDDANEDEDDAEERETLRSPIDGGRAATETRIAEEEAEVVREEEGTATSSKEDAEDARKRPEEGTIPAAEMARDEGEGAESAPDDEDEDDEPDDGPDDDDAFDDDAFPRARDFLVDDPGTADDAVTLVTAASIVEGFASARDDVDNDDARTVATNRTHATTVRPVSAAFRAAVAREGGSGGGATAGGSDHRHRHHHHHHPHRSIFDILDRNFEELGDGAGGGDPRRRVGHEHVKLCFAAFVAVFSLPPEPVFAKREDWNADGSCGDSHDSDDDDGGGKHSSRGDDRREDSSVLQKVPLSAAFALWSEVLPQLSGRRRNNAPNSANDLERLSYVRSTLVLLGLLDLATVERDRDDDNNGGGATTSTAVPGVGSFGGGLRAPDRKTVECLVVHDDIHQQYGEYLARGDDDHPRWNRAVADAVSPAGSDRYALRMLPLHLARALRARDAFDLLNEKAFVRRRMRALGPSGTARAHVGDVDELLRLSSTMASSAAEGAEPVDERERLLGAYGQARRYCLHEAEELSKPRVADPDGNVEPLGRTAAHRVADVGRALHLLGASLGGYGFFDEEMEYYGEALRLKTLAVDGDVGGSVPASDTLHGMGFSLDNAGRAEEALECYDRALDIRYDCLGDDDLRVAETLHNKGALLCEEGRADEALECLEEALRIRELHHGEEHESCADTMQWMGNLLRGNGDAANALDYFKFALSIKQKRLGANDIDVANTLFNTAVLLDDIEKHELSLVAYKEALRIRRLVLGSNNQEVADTLFCIGNVATVVEQHDEALRNYEESIEIREALILEDDPSAEDGLDDSLLFVSNPPSPGPDLLSQYEKLNQCYEEVFPVTKLIMGSDHPDLFDLLRRMGEVYTRLHDWDNAIGSFQGALRAKRADSPEGEEDDAEVASLLQKKGEAHLYKDEFERARTTFDAAVKIHERLSGPDSVAVASATYRLGVAYHYLNDHSRAKLLFRKCVQIQTKHGACVVRSLCWIGKQHERLDEPERALERYLSALRMYKKGRAPIDYRVVVMLLHAMGRLYEDENIDLQEMALKCYGEEISLIHSKLDVKEEQTTRMLVDAHFHPGMLNKKRGDVDKAIEHLEKALGFTTQCDGEDTVRVASITDNLGILHASRGEFSVAKKYYSTAYGVYEKSIGRDDLTTSDCAFRLGQVLEALESNLSLDFYKESLRVRRLNVPEDDERVGEILFCTGRVFLFQSSNEDAAKCFEEALGIRKRLLGECSDVANTHHNLGKTYCGMGQNEKALIFFRESVRINKKICERGALFKVALDMAQCATVCSHFQLAIDCYNDCLQGTESLDKKGANTALVLQKMGEIQMNKLHNYDDATKRLLDALEILRGVKDEDSDETQNIINLILLIAQSYASAKDYNNALDYYEEHIELLESNPPDDEDIIANSLCEMGNVFAAMDDPDYDLAIEKLVDCVDTKKKIFGADDECVADVVYTLASVYEKAGHHDKATESLAEALHSFQMHHNKAGSVKVYHALGRMKASTAAELDASPDERPAAIECYKEALKLRRQIMSLDDIELASMLYESSVLLILNNDHATALPQLEEALRIQKTKNGLKNERVANILLGMAEVHVEQEKYDSSLVNLEQVLLIKSSLAEKSCIDLGLCHKLLGTTYLARGEFQKAIASYSECLEAREWETEQLGSVHNDLGIAYGKVHDFDKAIQSFVQALKIRKTELGNNSLDYGHSVYNLAEIHISNQKHDQALNCLSEAIRVYELFPDEMSEKIPSLLEKKGDTLCILNDYEASVSTFQDCLELLDSLESESSVNEDTSSAGSIRACNEQAATVNCKMGHAFAKLGEYEEAFDSYREAINIFSTVLGKNDLRVGDVMYDVGQLIVSQGGDDVCQKSIEFFSEMIRIYGLQGKEKDGKVADALYQKSALLADCSEYDEASSMLDDALGVYKESLGDDAIQIGKAMLLYGRVHDAQGKSDDAMTAFEEALRIFKITLGEEDVNVSLALSNIGIIHARKFEYEQAVAKCKMALKIRVIRGEQDQDVADSVFNIANILNDWGEEEEAYEYFQQSLKLYIHIEDNVSVAHCWQKLGKIYWNRGDIDRSLQTYLDALHICEQQDEDDVANILISVYKGVGDCYCKKGQYDEALGSFAKCIRIEKMELGDDCIEMAETCDSIGLIYQKQQKYEEAMNLHSKAFLLNENHHGKESKECASSDFQIAKVLLASQKYEECVARFCSHLETYHCEGSDDKKEIAEVYHLLGLAQSKVEEYKESLTSLNKAVSIRLELCGKTDLKVAETMLDLGKVLGEWGDPDKAITVYDQAITIFRNIPDSNVFAIASAYSHLGALFEQKGNCEASLHSWKKALKIHSNSGSDSIAVGEILYHIGKMYDQLENFDKSAGCFSEAVKILRSKVGDNEMIGQALGYIGRNYARRQQYAKAVQLSTESLRLQKEFAEAGSIAESLVELGNILNSWGKTDQAIQFFEEALRTYEEAFGMDAVEVANCKQTIGNLYTQLGKSDTALRYFGEALQAFRLKEGDASLNVADNLFQIGRIYDSFGRRENSLKCFEESLKIRKEILGDDHLDVLAAQRFVKTINKKLRFPQ